MQDRTADGTAADIAADLATLRTDIKNLSETVAGRLRDRSNAAGAAMKGAVGDASDQISQAASRAQDSVFGAAADLEGRIERDPLTAILIAAGIGMAIGVMTKSRT